MGRDRSDLDSTSMSKLCDETSDLGIFCERAAAKDFTLQDIEEAYIQQILTRTAGNKTTAAEILGLNRTTLHRRLNRTTTPRRHKDA